MTIQFEAIAKVEVHLGDRFALESELAHGSRDGSTKSFKAALKMGLRRSRKGAPHRTQTERITTSVPSKRRRVEGVRTTSVTSCFAEC